MAMSILLTTTMRVARHPRGDEPVAPAERRGGVDHEAHDVDVADGAAWPCR